MACICSPPCMCPRIGIRSIRSCSRERRTRSNRMAKMRSAADARAAELLRERRIHLRAAGRARAVRFGRHFRARAADVGRACGPKDVDESTDAYDTIDWLVKHVPNNNGRVGMLGISYPGFYSACGMVDSHPALKCVSPQAPVCDWFIGDDFHHNGTLFLQRCVRLSCTGSSRSSTIPTRDEAEAVRLQNAGRL